jgi:hypothetical protein
LPPSTPGIYRPSVAELKCPYRNSEFQVYPSIPVADQRVPHIWPSFGQMWETRTSPRVRQLIE